MTENKPSSLIVGNNPLYSGQAYSYVPTLKQSGFLIGEPVAYTSKSTLPQ